MSSFSRETRRDDPAALARAEERRRQAGELKRLTVDPADVDGRCGKCGDMRQRVNPALPMFAPCAKCYPSTAEPGAVSDLVAIRLNRKAAADARSSLMATVDRLNPMEELYARYVDNGASLPTSIVDDGNREAYEAAKATFDALVTQPNGRGVPGFGLVGRDKGPGKTHLLVALVRDLRAAGIPALMFTVSGIIRAIVATFGDSERERELYNLLVTVPLLALDDLGKESYKANAGGATAWSVGLYFDVVNERWNRNLPIAASSNHDPVTLLETKYANDDNAEAIVDRMHGIFDLAWIPVTGASRRYQL